MPDDYRISDLSTVSSLGNSDLMEVSAVNSQSESGYTSMKMPVTTLANKVVNNIQYAADLQTESKTIIGAINEVAQGGGGGDAEIIKTASGAIASFETEFSAPLHSLKATINASGGGGTPDNPIPIVGFTECNITNEDGEGNVIDEITIDLNGTRYGGYVDVNNGKLVVTHGYHQVLSTDIVAEYFDTENGQFLARYTPSDPPKRTGSASVAGDVISNILTNKDQGSLYRDIENSVCIMGDADRFRLTFENCDTFEKMQTFLTNNETTLAYELATPIEIDITPEQHLYANVGQNNVFHDCNGSTEVKYYTKTAGEIKQFIEDDVEVSDLADVPDLPSTDGTYILKVTITDGVPTFSWEEEA